MKEERFRQLFAAFGTLTDCSLKFTKDGKFRKFGFIGFKSEEEAQRALNHFNKSFVDTSRITVSLPAIFPSTLLSPFRLMSSVSLTGSLSFMPTDPLGSLLNWFPGPHPPFLIQYVGGAPRNSHVPPETKKVCSKLAGDDTAGLKTRPTDLHHSFLHLFGKHSMSAS